MSGLKTGRISGTKTSATTEADSSGSRPRPGTMMGDDPARYGMTNKRASAVLWLEDCSGYEEDEAGEAGGDANEVESAPAVAELLPVGRQGCDRPGDDLLDDGNLDKDGYEQGEEE